MTNKLTKEEVLSKIKKVLREGYSFDKFEYNGMNEYCVITCNIHGDYKVKPACVVHQSHGCSECNKEAVRKEYLKRFTKELEELYSGNIKHTSGDYVTQHTKIYFHCSVHNSQMKTSMNSALRLPPCKSCRSVLEGDKFIAKAKELHGDKYLYDREDYVCSRTKMKITCTTHSKTFEQRPSAHLQGQGCPECGAEAARENSFKSQDFILEKIKPFVPDNISLSKMVYRGAFEKVTLICSKHGDFKMAPNNILFSKYNLCNKCSKEIIEENFRKDFFVKAKKVHGNLYDYSEVDYKNNTRKIRIKCKIHGVFTQTPNSHLSGRGCTYCAKLKHGRWSLKVMEKNKEYFQKEVCSVYLIKVLDFDGVYKIGISKDVRSRVGSIAGESGYSLELLDHKELTTWLCVDLESRLKKKLKEKQFLNGKVFGGYTELYTLDEKDLIDVKTTFSQAGL